MRFLTRVRILSVLGISSILYFGWILHSLHITTRINKAWTGSSHQLVVFGDSWSDIGEYRISPPDEASTPVRDAEQGKLLVTQGDSPITTTRVGYSDVG